MTEGWDAESSATYRALAAVAVPRRAEMIATILALAPFGRDAPARIVELASGEGFLAAALLDAFPNATLLALDGAEEMREATAARLEVYPTRAEVARFDLADDDWHHHLDGADLVVSSLALHHLDDDGKRDLYDRVAGALAPGGGIVIADIVHPATDGVGSFFGGQWDAAVIDASRELAGDDSLWERFDGADWNHYRTPDFEFDKPSVLADQLTWLRTAGLVADCFWMMAGHAVYGGYRPPIGSHASVPYDDALEIARRVLST